MRWRRLGFAVALVAMGAAGFLTATALRDEPRTAIVRPEARVQTGDEGRRAVPPVRASARVRALAGSLPLEARVAQLFLVGFEGTDASAPVFASMAERAWGAVAIEPENEAWPGAAATLAAELTARATGAGRTRPLVVADGLAAIPDQAGVTSPASARAAAQTAAVTLAASGIGAVLEPQADLAVPAGPSAETGFSDEPRLVARAARAAVDGWLAGGVLPAVGHFPGQGGASQDPIDGPSVVGAKPPLRAFVPALRRAPAVVLSNAVYTVYDPVTPAALVPAVARDLLRSQLRFRGAAITDDLAGAAAGTGGTAGAVAVRALRAGADLVQVRDEADREAAYEAVLRAARSGRIPRARLREALLRVLVLKERAGLLE